MPPQLTGFSCQGLCSHRVSERQVPSQFLAIMNKAAMNTVDIVFPHNYLENFTAAIPGHCCWVPILDNDTVSDNDSGILSQDDLLRISIPLDSNLRPDKCRRFVQPQWHLLHLNGTFSNVTEPDTEPCVDGWVYDRSTLISTTVTEVVRATMREEVEAARMKPTLCDLFPTPKLRRRMFLLCLLRVTSNIPLLGFSLHLHHLTTNVILLRCVSGAMTILASAGSFLLNHIGRRIYLLFLCFLFGIFILAIVFVPQEMQTLHLVFMTLAGANSMMIVSCNNLYSNELLPTVIRARAVGVIGLTANMGASLSPILITLTMYSTSLPWIIYGVLSITSGLICLFLPETKNKPLPDSIHDVENELKGSRQTKEEVAIIKVTRF
ncbi:solute carrier family 22 member 25-like protein [Cricetulus griseus]|uniref:Solute carrier family 22 member 25-like protein n=1 Tax=Cricetulus griseus TaxID=10029 RepID=A0A061IB57_CRIGR|nr:solute carrier family 22 member 25-like protein [Cricetulus griseus]